MTNTATHERLAEVAMELFLERGFDRVPAEEIAAQAGVSRRTFFRHFPSKDSVVFRAHAGRVEALAAAIARHHELSPTEAVRAGCLELAVTWETQAEAFQHQWAIVQGSSTLVARELELDRAFLTMFAEALARGPVGVDHKLVAGMLMGAFRSAIEIWLEGDCETPLVELGARALTLAIDGVGALDPDDR